MAVANGIDTVLNRVQSAGVDPKLDPPAPAAEPEKLSARDHSMLPCREFCH
jgi:hypothetical protein